MSFIPIVQNNQLFIKKICEFSWLVSWGRRVIETKQINKNELKRHNFFFEGEQSVSGFPVSLPLSKLFASVCKKEELVLGSLDGSDFYLFFSSVCAAFQPSAPTRLTPQGSNLQAPAGTEMGKVWLAWQVSAVPASLPWRCPLILPLPLQLSHKPHPKWNTDMAFKTLKKQFCEFMAFTSAKNITKILSQGPLLGFGSLSGILSLYVPVTMQEHGLPLPSAGVSAWLSMRCVALGLQPSWGVANGSGLLGLLCV